MGTEYPHDTHPNAARDRVADELARMARVEQRAIWRTSDNAGNPSDFASWALAASEAHFTVTPATVFNCWEMILHAGYAAGVISWDWIHSIYTHDGPYLFGQTWTDALPWLLVRQSTPWDAETTLPEPRRGDVVIFRFTGGGTAHVAIATGDRDTDGTHIYSFWPLPDVPFGDRQTGTPDRVKITTIEDLLEVCHQDGDCSVWIGTPRWEVQD